MGQRGGARKSACAHYSDWYYGRVKRKKTIDTGAERRRGVDVAPTGGGVDQLLGWVLMHATCRIYLAGGGGGGGTFLATQCALLCSCLAGGVQGMCSAR